MKAVAFLGEGKTGLIDIETPPLEKGQVLVRVTRSAICGSDMGPNKANFLAKKDVPTVVGHESVGIVEKSNSRNCKTYKKRVQGCTDPWQWTTSRKSLYTE